MTEQAKPSLVSRFKDGHLTYEQRFVDCGNPKCSKCGEPGQRRPSHGPYWYLCAPVKGLWVRLYVGKVLDLTKHRTDSGTLTSYQQTEIFDQDEERGALGLPAKNPSTCTSSDQNETPNKKVLDT